MTAMITALLGLSGYPLVGVICGLIVLEEVGVPMPMAPGDLLLVLAGVSIAAGHVNPLVAVPAVYISALLGAVGGREIFLRIGSAALPRIASLLHAGDRIDRLAASLRRGGAGAVFLGRITPGMRINTTYASGLVALRRRTFLAGLVPAIAVYDLVFISLGAWFGRSALTTIEVYTHEPVVLLLVVLIVVALGLAAHVLVRYNRGRRRRRPRRASTPRIATSPAVTT
jgi:membrane protein DedA with SNARE-associated domain